MIEFLKECGRKIERIKINIVAICKKKKIAYFKCLFATLATAWSAFCATESIYDYLWKYISEDSYIKIESIEWSGFLYCALIVFAACVVACFRYLYEPFSVEFPIANGKTEVKIEYGDLFQKKNVVAIGVNNFFDSCVKHDVIKSPTLHWQFITKILKNDASLFDEAVDSVRKKGAWTPGRIDTRDKDLKDKKHRCEIGSTAFVEYEGVKYACTVISEMPNDSFVAESSNSKIMEATKKMLNAARGVCGDEEIALPVWGTGLSRCVLNEKQMIELLLATILEVSNEQRVSKKITIVIYKNKYGEIDLTSLKEKWG